MQTFLLIVILILVVINFKQADELRDLERKTLDGARGAASGGRRRCAANRKKYRALRSAPSEQGDNISDRK